MNNPNCCGSGPHVIGAVRVMPIGGGGNLILCSACWKRELRWREERNRELDEFAKFDLLPWKDAKLYETA